MKAEREKQILHVNVYMWHLEKWHKWICFQGRDRGADAANRLVGTAGEGEGGVNWESSTALYTPPCADRQLEGTCWSAQGAQRRALRRPRGLGWMHIYGWFVTLYSRNSHTVSNYTPIKKKRIKGKMLVADTKGQDTRGLKIRSASSGCRVGSADLHLNRFNFIWL